MHTPILNLIVLADIGSELAAKAGQIGRDFGMDWPMFLAQLISFCVVAFLLRRFAYEPVLAALEQRRQRIAESIANAEKIKSELARAEAKAQEIIREATEHANRIIEEARQTAAQLHQRETQKAIATAEAIIEKARRTTELERARMLAELRSELGRLVVDTTARVTGKVLTPEDHKRLLEETARELATSRLWN
ncbi:MAG: F0F1 ATP synthase subunit B [Verrucomicrobiae bacterium]|nr:F0F1 ATP synthase subunit B [Verrucomicrobiae bacterium]MDW7981148.1 F0F1 ATP synthase subunit B [Verrucomicrobiales bacterium]